MAALYLEPARFNERQTRGTDVRPWPLLRGPRSPSLTAACCGEVLTAGGESERRGDGEIDPGQLRLVALLIVVVAAERERQPTLECLSGFG